jgi:Mn2+/Fe2+ NRAMP family transporter
MAMINKYLPIPKWSFWKRITIFLAIIGPGIITGSVDNDAGGITVYSVAGAIHGYNMLWTLIPSFILLIVIQEMNARMGIVTGKGLANLIRESAGVKITFYITVGLFIANIGNTTTEFAGVAGSGEVFGISKYLTVPFVAIGVWFLVVKGNYKFAERVFLVFSFSLFIYIISALMGNPEWGKIGHAMIRPEFTPNLASIALIIGIVGTTIAPWMQFYMQASVIEKGLKIKDLKYTLIDVVVGCVATVVVAFFIIVACASTLHKSGVTINEAKDAALALQPLAGQFAGAIFAFGLFIASIFSATILPLATAFYICEAMGFEAGIDKKWNEANEFFIIYTSMIIISAGIILMPNIPLIKISVWSQVLNGVLLPVVLFYMIVLINKKSLMGKYTNKLYQNVIGWAAVIILVILSLSLIIIPLF